jgi:hypothetical protein
MPESGVALRGSVRRDVVFLVSFVVFRKALKKTSLRVWRLAGMFWDGRPAQRA